MRFYVFIFLAPGPTRPVPAAPASPRRPTRRSGHVAVIRHEFMYVYGGYDTAQIGPGRTFPELWRYHLLTEREW